MECFDSVVTAPGPTHFAFLFFFSFFSPLEPGVYMYVPENHLVGFRAVSVDFFWGLNMYTEGKQIFTGEQWREIHTQFSIDHNSCIVCGRNREIWNLWGYHKGDNRNRHKKHLAPIPEIKWFTCGWCNGTQAMQVPQFSIAKALSIKDLHN